MRTLIPFVVLTSIGAAAFAQTAPETIAVMQIAPDAFVATVASSNQFEIQSSQLAQQKSRMPDVKAFADQMVVDHTKAGQELTAIAGTDPAAHPLAPKHAAMLARLQQANDADFDTIYVDMQATAHAEAVTLFSTFVAERKNDELHQFAASTLPVLEQHKMHIDEIVAAH